MAKITINDKNFEVDDGCNVLEACIAVGIKLEHFCYHRYLPVDGNCRTCMIELETPRGKMLTVACNTKVSDGMVVTTESEKATTAQKSALEFLLLDHPLDCPICDKAGECKLQNHYMDFGRYEHRRDVDRYFKGGKVQDIGDHIILDNERCILCTRCVRFLDNVPETSELGIINRGHEAKISIFPGQPITNDYSGNITDVCPVGALTAKEFRFKQRVWFLKKDKSICTKCSRGCSITIEHNKGKIFRFMPRENKNLNRVWMCDEGRFSFSELQENRQMTSLLSGEEKDLDSVMNTLKELIAKTPKEKLGVILSANSSNETSWQALKLSDNYSSVIAEPKNKPDNILKLAAHYPNENGLNLLGVSKNSATLLEKIKASKIETLIIVENDLENANEWKEAISKVSNVIILSSTKNEMVNNATVTIAVRNYSETDGSFVNATSLLQTTRHTIEPKQGNLPSPLVILSLISSFAGNQVPTEVNASIVFAEMAKQIIELKGKQFSTIDEEGDQLSIEALSEVPFKDKKIDFNIVPCAIKQGGG